VCSFGLTARDLEGVSTSARSGATHLMTDPDHPSRRTNPAERSQPDPHRHRARGGHQRPGRTAAPTPVGDVVPGEPPVPITVWHLPRPAAGTPVSTAMARRLVGNYTRPGARVVDLTAGGELPDGDSDPVELVITNWPRGVVAAADHLGGWAASLRPGGCLAIVITATETPDQLGPLVHAARELDLTYLQHIVIAHHLTGCPPAEGDAATAAAGPTSRAANSGGRHLRVHTDVLIMRRREHVDG
jgi:hypothetical protein